MRVVGNERNLCADPVGSLGLSEDVRRERGTRVRTTTAWWSVQHWEAQEAVSEQETERAGGIRNLHAGWELRPGAKPHTVDG